MLCVQKENYVKCSDYKVSSWSVVLKKVNDQWFEIHIHILRSDNISSIFVDSLNNLPVCQK